MMTHVNNIFGIRVNSASTNSSMNFGNVIHKGHQANVKATVGYAQAGDSVASPVGFQNLNNTVDPDVNDQAQSQV